METKKQSHHHCSNDDSKRFSLWKPSKADTLKILKPFLKKSIINHLFVFKVTQWQTDPKEIIKKIQMRFAGKIIVRSSANVEDSQSNSHAGIFHSELNVDPMDLKNLTTAIETIIENYERYEGVSDKSQLFVQKQSTDVMISGVVFTRNLNNYAPYYLINYDTSEATYSVTSGIAGNTINIPRNLDLKTLPFPWSSLLEAIQEIELLVKESILDIEFAVTREAGVVIFQIRPLAANAKLNRVPDALIFAEHNKFKDHLADYFISQADGILSDMAFWNPAEIIGDRTCNLSYSLYDHLIMSRAWNVGLIALGYGEINDNLMLCIGNKPYIDVITAFNALLPRTLEAAIAKKAVGYYADKLREKPHFHDKIEFEIVDNIYGPTTREKMKELEPILNPEEKNSFINSLIHLTQAIFDNYEAIKQADLKALETLAEKRKMKLDQVHGKSLQEKIIAGLALLKDAQQFGTPQFSRMARLAFIGSQYLKGLVIKGALSRDEADGVLASISTVATELDKDYHNMLNHKISFDLFIEKYGHLRPCTYDITRLPYSKDINYFKDSGTHQTGESHPFDPTGCLKKIALFLSSYPIQMEAEFLLNFIQETIGYREQFKFEFTKNLNAFLELLAAAGKELGFTRQELSHLSLEDLKSIGGNTPVGEIITLWQSIIETGEKKATLFNCIPLPSVLFSEKDLYFQQNHSAVPNFITRHSIHGEIIFLDDLETKEYGKIKGKIVFVKVADPGFDWIFSKGISGLVTQFGGAGSHMAIRCAEFDIPAAIGCGESLYSRLKKRNLILMDCKNRTITPIR